MADLSITAANLVPDTNAQFQSGTAGATITAGQALYLDAVTSTLKLADANLSLAAATCVGIAAHGASAGQPIKYLTGGDFTVGATVAAGIPYGLSLNAGGICAIGDLTSGWYGQVLIIGLTTAKDTVVLAKPSTLVAIA